MHNLEQLIAEWRKAMPDVGPETLEELESHLRDAVDQHVGSGMTVEKAFQLAASQLGSPSALSSELRKTEPTTWLPVKVLAWTGVVFALLLLAFLMLRFDTAKSGQLLTWHIFAVTSGYVTVYFSGALGGCYILYRTVGGISPLRLRSLREASFHFAAVSLVLTLIGTVLGMFWSRAEMGRYWAWDPRETGALCTLVWLVCFLIAHRAQQISAHIILITSVLGSIVVSLAWFGPALIQKTHSYGSGVGYGFLFAALIFNGALFLTGLAPAGWIRSRRMVR